ncbi:MAG: amidase family protein [Chloroflexota bacterium]|nr:amidase family protein [Chloroflexota bacterium]
MVQRTSPQSSLSLQSPVNRRQLITVGAGAAGAAVVGIGAASLFGNDANSIQPGDGTTGATPPPATPAPAPTLPAASTPDDPDAPDVIDFEDPVEPSDASEPAATPAAGTIVNPADILEEVTIRQLRESLDGGAFTIAELVQATLERIDRIDGGEIAVNAIINLNPDAAQIAAELDAELQAGQSRGLMHGIPVLLKDIIATSDGMPNTAGSLALVDNTVVRDSFLATRLREAGGVILGKTNLTEWSNFMGSTGLSGWSSLGGLTVNPYDLNRSCSGSSSGSAAAVSASYVPIALGAEFDGSIIAPAAICGIVGVKPTVGLTSRAGVIPIGFSRDSIGPMARTVEDAAIALSVLAGFDPEDPSRTVGTETSPHAMFDEEMVPEPGTVDYTTALDPDALRGARVGICANYQDFDEGSQALFDAVLPIMEEAGAELVPDVAIPSIDDISSTYVNSLTEFAWGLQNYLDTYTPDGPMRTIQDLVDFNFEHADEELNVTDQSGLTDALEALPIDDPTYIQVTVANQEAIRANGIDAVMDELELDALIAPTATLAAGAWERSGFMSSSFASSVAGYPSVTLPIGLSDGLPGGIHFFGRAFSEDVLLGLAYALEQQLPPRAVPTYIPREE